MRLNYLFVLVKKSRLLRNCFRGYLNHCPCKYVTPISAISSFSTSTIQSAPMGDSDNEMEIGTDLGYSLDNSLIDHNFARDLLYKDSKDLLLKRISKCASIQELFNVFHYNSKHYNCHHITQTVLVLHDFKKIYQNINSNSRSDFEKSSIQFLNHLEENKRFTDLLDLIDKKINQFGYTTLSHTMLYLNKLGLKVTSPTIQLLSQTLEKSLLVKFLISPAAKYLQTAFNEVNIRSYYMSQSLIPHVVREIDNCSTVSDLKDLTLALNKLHNVLTAADLEKYRTKVETLIKTKMLSAKDAKTILQIISFLNYPKWRIKSGVLIAQCMLLIKDNFCDLDINEIILLYDVFYGLQEPGRILNELQRYSSKCFHQLDDDRITSQKIRLFGILTYFAGPKSRGQFQQVLKKYVTDCKDLDNLLLLRKLLSYIKVSDAGLWKMYWDKVLRLFKDSSDVDLIRISHHYLSFVTNLDHFRHKEFESKILVSLEKSVNDLIYNYYIQKISNILSFVLVFEKDTRFINKLITHLEANWEEISAIDCLKLSQSIRLLQQSDEKYLKSSAVKKINSIIDKVISKHVNLNNDLFTNTALLQTCIYNGSANSKFASQLFDSYNDSTNISSKSIENINYYFFVTGLFSSTIILDNIVDYIVTYKDHILGFQVAKTVFLLYYFGYTPRNAAVFFDTVYNVVIRDKERMSGLSLIQCALGLCYFNKLPYSLVKSIFNVEFMDKLDNELENCYSKESYPHRVRTALMQLNRAVCLGYPESNVPWFHQKFLDSTMSNQRKNFKFGNRVKEYLYLTVGKAEAITEDVLTPYGYEIDFVISFNSRNEPVTKSQECTKKVALLLIPDLLYVKALNQLKGSLQLKQRHLEILGYKVVIIKFSDWLSLFYSDEKVKFLRNSIWSKKFNEDTYR